MSHEMCELGEEGWQFDLDGQLVTQLRIDHRFTLVLEDGAHIVIEEPFDLWSGSEVERVPPGEDPAEVQAALALFNQRIVAVRALPDGVLQVSFSGGASLVVPTNPAYESWQILEPGGRMWIGSPGGGVASYLPGG